MNKPEQLLKERTRSNLEVLGVRGQLGEMTPDDFVEHVFRIVRDPKQPDHEPQHAD